MHNIPHRKQQLFSLQSGPTHPAIELGTSQELLLPLSRCSRSIQQFQISEIQTHPPYHRGAFYQVVRPHYFEGNTNSQIRTSQQDNAIPEHVNHYMSD